MEPIKAIEILQLNVRENGKKMPADVLRALMLSIEATQRLLTMRSYNINEAIMPLPSER